MDRIAGFSQASVIPHKGITSLLGFLFSRAGVCALGAILSFSKQRATQGGKRDLPPVSDSSQPPPPLLLLPVSISAHLLEVSELKAEMEAFRLFSELFYLPELVGDDLSGKDQEAQLGAAWEMELHDVLLGP